MVRTYKCPECGHFYFKVGRFDKHNYLAVGVICVECGRRYLLMVLVKPNKKLIQKPSLLE